MDEGTWIPLAYGGTAFVHARFYARHTVNNWRKSSPDGEITLAFFGALLWPLVDSVLLGMRFQKRYPRFARRIFIAAEPRRERKLRQLEESKAKTARLERELLD